MYITYTYQYIDTIPERMYVVSLPQIPLLQKQKVALAKQDNLLHLVSGNSQSAAFFGNLSGH